MLTLHLNDGGVAALSDGQLRTHVSRVELSTTPLSSFSSPSSYFNSTSFSLSLPSKSFGGFGSGLKLPSSMLIIGFIVEGSSELELESSSGLSRFVKSDQAGSRAFTTGTVIQHAETRNDVPATEIVLMRPFGSQPCGTRARGHAVVTGSSRRSGIVH